LTALHRLRHAVDVDQLLDQLFAAVIIATAATIVASTTTTTTVAIATAAAATPTAAAARFPRVALFSRSTGILRRGPCGHTRVRRRSIHDRSYLVVVLRSEERRVGKE